MAKPQFRVIPATAGGVMISLNRKSRSDLIALIKEATADETLWAPKEIKLWKAFIRELEHPTVGPLETEES
jgi:hypothetical protein